MHAPPLCVDLDGTLLKSDLLLESCLALLSQRPLDALRVPAWLLHGRAYLKEQVATRVRLDVSRLPYRGDLIDYLAQEHKNGRVVVLATASHRLIADDIAAYLGIFDRVLATEGDINLSGRVKSRILQAEFGHRGFTYAGNERKDLHVWRAACEAILVDASPRMEREVRDVVPIAARYQSPRESLRDYVRTLRLHQWVKNLLIFMPLLAAHELQNLLLTTKTTIAFLSFGLCASSVYVLNDLLDLASDRKHPRKRFRSFAAGRIDLFFGVWLSSFLLVIAIVLATTLPRLFVGALCGYYVTTLVYSVWAKRRAIFDVICLAGLYTVRILAGAAATGIAPSFWLLAFSMFLFLSLALVKRYSELVVTANGGVDRLAGRGYTSDDVPILQSMGTASGYMAVLVLALYINSPDILKTYHHPRVMWVTCLLLLFWISRVWLKAQRGQMHDDPIVFAATDRASQLVAVCALLAVAIAT